MPMNDASRDARQQQDQLTLVVLDGLDRASVLPEPDLHVHDLARLLPARRTRGDHTVRQT